MTASRFAWLIVLAACGARPVTPKAESFGDVTTAVLADLERLEPARGVALGHHEHDGKLPDRSPAGIEAEVDQLKRDRELVAQHDPTTLSPLEREERDTLLQELRGLLFGLTELDQYRKNPMAYADAIDLDQYIVRDYAPAAERAAAVTALCGALPAYLAQARANLTSPMPRPWLATALLQTRGMAELADRDVRHELGGASPDLPAALDTCKHALDEHAAWLDAQTAHATDDFALGDTLFLRMLAETQGIEADLPTLRRVVEQDIARNVDALAAAAKQIDPKKSIAEVIATAATDRPAAADLVSVAQAETDQLRAFLVAHQVVTLPTDEVAVVRETPAFERWNFAFMDAPGSFEPKRLASYFYITPPDSTWPADQQQAYIRSRAVLLYTAAHEVYPGHFVHALHVRKNPSAVLRSIMTFSTGEGWAHYCEEMMYEAGAGDHRPEMHVAQLQEALVRDVRFVVALGEHTGGMTIDQAEQLFRDRAFMDPAGAHQQAVRGTFDPMYLSYTLGKLVIMKLRDDWRKQHPDASLRDFHDAFLSHGGAPLPVIRRAMHIDTALL